jgi:hypothetical protein
LSTMRCRDIFPSALYIWNGVVVADLRVELQES